MLLYAQVAGCINISSCKFVAEEKEGTEGGSGGMKECLHVMWEAWFSRLTDIDGCTSFFLFCHLYLERFFCVHASFSCVFVIEGLICDSFCLCWCDVHRGLPCAVETCRHSRWGWKKFVWVREGGKAGGRERGAEHIFLGGTLWIYESFLII